MRPFSIASAISSLCPDAKFEMLYDEYDNLIWHTPDISIPSKEEVLAELDRLKLEEEKKQYIYSRIREYPDFGSQMDILYHLGYDGWKDCIKSIKDKYPKPE